MMVSKIIKMARGKSGGSKNKAVVRVVVVVVVKAKTRKKANRHSSNKDIKAGEGHMFMYLR